MNSPKVSRKLSRIFKFAPFLYTPRKCFESSSVSVCSIYRRLLESALKSTRSRHLRDSLAFSSTKIVLAINRTMEIQTIDCSVSIYIMKIMERSSTRNYGVVLANGHCGGWKSTQKNNTNASEVSVFENTLDK